MATGNGAIYNAPVNPTAYSGTIQSMNRNFKQGVIQQFNLNVERQLPANVVLTLGYAGTRSAHILVSQVNENLEDPAACADGAGPVSGYTLGCNPGAAYPFAPYPFAPYGQPVSSNNSIGQARYDSLQIKAETKTSHGLYALLGYTYSRNFDSGLPDGLGTNPGAIYWPLAGAKKLDWGLSSLNLNNSFTASVIYDLPFGKGKHFGGSWNGVTDAVAGHWQVNLIERATSGFPLYVVDSTNPSEVNFSYNGLTISRPDQMGDPNKAGIVSANPNPGCQTWFPGCTAPTQIHTISNWFNQCAFVSAPFGELGTGVRAPVYGPRFVNTDFSLIKDIPFRETMNVQFRAEFFNLFNHPQYFLDGISDTGEQDIGTSSSFGVINNTVNNPRLIQFALKLRF